MWEFASPMAGQTCKHKGLFTFERSKVGSSHEGEILERNRVNDCRLEPGQCDFQANPGGGVLPYMGYIGMCGPKGYGFSAVLVINRVSIIAILPPLW